MPTYTLYDQTADEYWDDVMSYNDLQTLLADNPHIKHILQAPAFISNAGNLRVDNGFKEMQSRIAQAHPNSALADRVGGRSTKEIKTKQAYERYKKRSTQT